LPTLLRTKIELRRVGEGFAKPTVKTDAHRGNVFAPKGPNMPAQGNALGKNEVNSGALKGHNNRMRTMCMCYLPDVCCALSGL
jgi:hypothetical protein